MPQAAVGRPLREFWFPGAAVPTLCGSRDRCSDESLMPDDPSAAEAVMLVPGSSCRRRGSFAPSPGGRGPQP